MVGAEVHFSELENLRPKGVFVTSELMQGVAARPVGKGLESGHDVLVTLWHGVMMVMTMMLGLIGQLGMTCL